MNYAQRLAGQSIFTQMNAHVGTEVVHAVISQNDYNPRSGIPGVDFGIESVFSAVGRQHVIFTEETPLGGMAVLHNEECALVVYHTAAVPSAVVAHPYTGAIAAITWDHKPEQGIVAEAVDEIKDIVESQGQGFTPDDLWVSLSSPAFEGDPNRCCPYTAFREAWLNVGCWEERIGPGNAACLAGDAKAPATSTKTSGTGLQAITWTGKLPSRK